MNLNNNSPNLFSRITLQARSSLSLDEIKCFLLDHPGLSLISSEEFLTYAVKEDCVKEYSFKIEISKKNISILTYSNQSPTIFLKEAIIRLLLILSFMKDIYTIELSDLYPYLTTFLMKDVFDSSTFQKLDENIDFNSPDIILSKRIIELLKENKDLKKDTLSFKSITLRLIPMILFMKYQGRISLKLASKELGLEEDKLKSFLEEIKTFGFAIIWNNKSEFTLVKT